MEVIHLRYDEKIETKADYVVAIGNFEGIHLGHREVIKKAARIAKDKDLQLAVMCFDITPRQVVNDINNYYVLRSFEQKKDILASLGVSTLFLIHFNKKIMDLTPDEFVQEMIIDKRVKYLVCGYDFMYGRNKTGNTTLLQQYSEFNTVILPRYEYNQEKVSSTLIHEMLLHGEIEQVNRLLVQPYTIVGHVVKGNQKGRTIGFPTANIVPIVNYRIPQTGVYASIVKVKGKEYYAMTNIGHNPTFNFCSVTSIESNIFSFNQEIYDELIEVTLVKFCRREKIFSDVELLVKQLEYDRQEIKAFFEI
ncbi:riboflavin biosynthesis protein RibF [Erysipelotrichaceae bacterium OttesenSCG-928-M19]|nr:riboflavin biosynthesis protein RibF [Erysipelotrichaceae bacterium OttesenSCG-928-M19]